MNKYKRIIAGLMAISMILGVTACGSSDSSSVNDDSFEATENVKIADAESIESIPEGSEKTIIYLGENDLNPTKKDPEISTELALFQKKGGSIQWQSTTNASRFDDLATAIASNKDVPDIFKYEWLSFPSQVVRKMYQPIDSIVDFSQPLWEGAKATADQFVLNGEHYVAPLAYDASAFLTYDTKTIDTLGLDDPYELYLNNEWTWSAWQDIMQEYVDGSTEEEPRYGVNGFFRAHIVQQTGKNLVNFNSDTQQFENNMKDADIEYAQTFLYELNKNGLVLNGWIGGATDCFKQKCLFYAMGAWAVKPKEGDEWAIVPMPSYDSNPQKITTSDMKAFMWVTGSTKSDAVKCWFECYRASRNDPAYAEANKDKFMENNQYWTDDMYQTSQDIVSDDYLMVFDYAYGVSSKLGDRNQFDGNQCLVDALYGSSSTTDDEGNQPTWTQIREEYTATVDSELSALNEKVVAYNSGK